MNVFWSTNVKTEFNETRQTLGNILEKKVDKKYKIDKRRLDEWKYAKGHKNEFRLRKKDRNNVDPELVALYDECMNAPFGKRMMIWKEHRATFMAAVGENAFYHYDEGNMGFDSIDWPSRTVVTAEIGSTPSRMRHIFEDDNEDLRRLTPVETERLNMFPDNWTLIDKIGDSKRGFMMGNALVVGVIVRLREPLKNLINRRS